MSKVQKVLEKFYSMAFKSLNLGVQKANNSHFLVQVLGEII